METFSSIPPINLFEEGIWLLALAVKSFGAANSVFSITDENNSFSNSSPSYWIPDGGEEFIN